MLLTPLFPVLLGIAAAPPPQPIDSSPVTRPQSVLDIPDPIAPAVLPYLACLYDVRGLPFVLGKDRTQISFHKSNGNCTEERQRAQANAIALLQKNQASGHVEPRAYVENALSKVDEFVASLPVGQHAETSGHEPPVGVPFTLEDEVKPAYNHYEDCLKTQVSYTSLTIATIMSVFKQAMAVCWSVRASAVADAENALSQKGWDEATRARAAENTFATADQAWLEMGRQFHDSLVARMKSGHKQP